MALGGDQFLSVERGFTAGVGNTVRVFPVSASGATAKQPQPNPLLDDIEGAALGGSLPGGRRLLYLISDDNGSATQITRTYAFAGKRRGEATLDKRAIIPATAYQPGPVSGTQLTPDTVDGFGAENNSADFLLRAYKLRMGHGVAITGRLDFRDPDHKVPFPIVDENTRDRLLTGADFDVESPARDARGTCGSVTSSART